MFDTRPQAADHAIQAITQQWQPWRTKAASSPPRRRNGETFCAAADTLDAFKSCELVVEAIVEQRDAKRDLFLQLETIVAADALLASNTSSLSITALAAGLTRPERFAGFHFFNPCP